MKQSIPKALPPGQRTRQDFPRFGLPKYARRYRTQYDALSLFIGGNLRNELTLRAGDFDKLPRVEQISDFHCVTTWSKLGICWGGYRFIDFYQMIVKPQAQPIGAVNFVTFRSQDGFRATLPLQDLLNDDVLLADQLEGQVITAKHGAPIRLIAPAHYGYKSAKHLKAIEFHEDLNKASRMQIIVHSRGRVALEERGYFVPAWLLRLLYRPLIKWTAYRFRHAMRE